MGSIDGYVFTTHISGNNLFTIKWVQILLYERPSSLHSGTLYWSGKSIPTTIEGQKVHDRCPSHHMYCEALLQADI